MENKSLQYYLIEGESLKEMRDYVESFDMNKFPSDSKFFEWYCKNYLNIIIVGVRLYYLEKNELIKKIINHAKIICNTSDPYFKDEHNNDLTYYLLLLKEDVFVNDYTSALYDQIEWCYNDFWKFESSCDDWRLMSEHSR